MKLERNGLRYSLTLTPKEFVELGKSIGDQSFYGRTSPKNKRDSHTLKYSVFEVSRLCNMLLKFAKCGIDLRSINCVGVTIEVGDNNTLTISAE